MYPLDFTEIHAVEVETDLFQKPSTPPLEVPAYEINSHSRLRPFHGGPAGFPAWLMQRVHPYNFFISSQDNHEEAGTAAKGGAHGEACEASQDPKPSPSLSQGRSTWAPLVVTRASLSVLPLCLLPLCLLPLSLLLLSPLPLSLLLLSLPPLSLLPLRIPSLPPPSLPPPSLPSLSPLSLSPSSLSPLSLSPSSLSPSSLSPSSLLPLSLLPLSLLPLSFVPLSLLPLSFLPLSLLPLSFLPLSLLHLSFLPERTEQRNPVAVGRAAADRGRLCHCQEGHRGGGVGLNAVNTEIRAVPFLILLLLPPSSPPAQLAPWSGKCCMSGPRQYPCSPHPLTTQWWVHTDIVAFSLPILLLLPPHPLLPPNPSSEHKHSEHDAVAAGRAAIDRGGLGGGEDGHRGGGVGCMSVTPQYPSSPHHPLFPPPQNTVNVTRWLLDELQLTEEDSVVVKMDIEGADERDAMAVGRAAADRGGLGGGEDGHRWGGVGCMSVTPQYPSSPHHPPFPPPQNTVNVTRWLMDELQLTEEDSVVVKMDIEGAEWAVLHEWLAIPHMPAIVDELFVEVHYHHPSMEGLTWTDRFNHTLDDTTQLLTDLRRAGFYVHPWP
ncbi:unnamed protein product [Closterium sp. NIES-65]|nr:unnamed protein product [Closterium sp. NIES-65]